MDYENKYKEALEKARQLCAYPTSKPFISDLQDLFPELKESEDERIREGLIQYFSTFTLNTFAGLDPKKILSWLEKQGEQKISVVEFKAKDWYVSKVDGKIYNAKFMEKTPTNQARKLEIEKAAMSATGIIEQEEWFIKGAEWSDKNPSYISSEKQGEKSAGKVEPKFHEGDWAVSNLDRKARQISEVCCDEYNNYYVVKGKEYNIDEYDRLHHLWTIQDAKDGDVLFYKGNIKNSNGIKYERICLFNNLDNAFFTLTKTSNYVEEYDIDVNIDYPDDTVPATKEQKEILFMAMKDAGYTFDFDKKEFKKIEQKPAWSEEDETMITNIIIMLKEGASLHFNKKDITKTVDWLKSIKPLPKKEWSEEDENYYDAIITKLEVTQEDALLTDNQMNFLKSLKDRVQPKQKWSEEDERMYRELYNSIYSTPYCDSRKEFSDWFKTLKERYTWKPSDEQMIAIQEAMNIVGILTITGSKINSLYQDLKKLKNDKL